MYAFKFSCFFLFLLINVHVDWIVYSVNEFDSWMKIMMICLWYFNSHRCRRMNRNEKKRREEKERKQINVNGSICSLFITKRFCDDAIGKYTIMHFSRNSNVIYFLSFSKSSQMNEWSSCFTIVVDCCFCLVSNCSLLHSNVFVNSTLCRFL